jgi:hypothetical protein
MCYRIIITSNGKKKRIIDKSNNISKIKKKYFSLVDRNKVLFPKQTSAYLKTKPVKYEILLLKKREDDDTPYIDRDEMGRTIEIEDANKKWTIIEKNSYKYEEKFTVYGLKSRLTTIEIIKLLLLRGHKTPIMKQINYVENKLLIHQDNDFDIVLCKCPLDAEKLYKTLKEFVDNNNITHTLFTGSINLNKKDTYKMIVEKTGWNRDKVYRKVTRP